MNKPIAVLTSDVHYNVHTLPLADAAMRQAINKANELNVPLIVAGDLHDTKANLRGECIKAIRETMKLAHKKPIVLIGNHDLINERGSEHSLYFLEDLVTLITKSRASDELKINFVAYQSNPKDTVYMIKRERLGYVHIIHQGLNGSESGDYIQDKSALEYEDVKDFRVISGHYHKRQDIKTGPPRKGAVGLFSYIGNPYTLGFGEANDPTKGFQILMDDGTLEFVPTNLRKHVIFNIDFVGANYQITGKVPLEDVYNGDLVWAKVRGTKEQIANMNKSKFLKACDLPENSRLDLIPTDTETSAPTAKDQTQGETLDSLIDSLTNTSEDRKARLKELWKNSVTN